MIAEPVPSLASTSCTTASIPWVSDLEPEIFLARYHALAKLLLHTLIATAKVPLTDSWAVSSK